MHGIATVCLHPPSGSGGSPGVLAARPHDSIGHEPISVPVRKPSQALGSHGWPFALRPWSG
jgi:hypothetical protein